MEPEIHVIGGGLGGLAAATMVARAGHSVTVHEGRGRLGGRATTDERDGFRFNQGPHALYLDGDAARVLTDLGVRPRGSSPPVPATRMVRDGEVHLAPVGPWSLLRSGILGVRDKLEVARLLSRIPRLDPESVAGMTTAAWVDSIAERARVRELLHTLIRLTTYVHAPHHLSAQVAATQLQFALGQGVIYLDDGWEQLVETLAEVATRAGVRIERGSRVTELPDAPVVIVATGGPGAASALTGHPYASGMGAAASVLDLGLSEPPEIEVLLGVDVPIYGSNHGFPSGMVPPGRASVSVAEYLAPGVEPDRQRLRDFASHLGVRDESIVTERYLHRMPTVTAIATADSGGFAGRPGTAVPDRPGVFVVGDWVGPRGHLADATLASATDAARAAMTHLASRSTSKVGR